jgi:uncharacterized protein YbjT (DUF2867 family)
MRMKSTEQETILVTGATGTLGSEVVKQLSRNKSDVKVKAAVHSNENVRPFIQLKMQKKYSSIILLAQQVSHRQNQM